MTYALDKICLALVTALNIFERRPRRCIALIYSFARSPISISDVGRGSCNY